MAFLLLFCNWVTIFEGTVQPSWFDYYCQARSDISGQLITIA